MACERRVSPRLLMEELERLELVLITFSIGFDPRRRPGVEFWRPSEAVLPWRLVSASCFRCRSWSCCEVHVIDRWGCSASTLTLALAALALAQDGAPIMLDCDCANEKHRGLLLWLGDGDGLGR